MATLLEQKVTDYLTAFLGTAPDLDQITAALNDPYILSQVHNSLNVGQSILTVELDGSIQDAIDSVSAAGGGVVYLKGGTYNLTAHLIVPSSIHIEGVGSVGTILDFGGGAYQIQCIGTDVYSTGTVSINNAGTTVTGVGTTWNSGMEGRQIFLQGQWYVIDTVSSTTSLIIDTAYVGTNLAGSSYTIANPNNSVSINGLTVQNSSTDLIKVQYAFNFSGNDVASLNGTSGINLDTISIFNYNIGYVQDCTYGILTNNLYGMTISNTFLTNCTSGGYGFVNTFNAVCTDSAVNGGGGYGYSLTGCTNFGIDEISITNIGGIGMLFDNSSFGLAIYSGFIDSCTSDGMKLQNSSSQMQCSIMQITNNGGYGVNVSDGGSSDNIFSTSFFGNNTSGNFHDSGTGTKIRSNIGVADN